MIGNRRLHCHRGGGKGERRIRLVGREAERMARDMITAAICFGRNSALKSIRRAGLTPGMLADISISSAVVLRAANAVLDRGQEVDALSICRELQARGEAERVGAPLSLVELPGGMPLHAGHVQYHAARLRLIVENRRRARRHRAVAAALEGESDPLEARDRALELARGGSQ